MLLAQCDVRALANQFLERRNVCGVRQVELLNVFGWDYELAGEEDNPFACKPGFEVKAIAIVIRGQLGSVVRGLNQRFECGLCVAEFLRREAKFFLQLHGKFPSNMVVSCIFQIVGQADSGMRTRWKNFGESWIFIAYCWTVLTHV
jgi:hypothetical protein